MRVVERVLEGQSNMGGERVGMSIDPSAFAHIMGVLTDLYSDPELAVIREYSTNAWDSHVEAGISLTRPIEITLPSPLSPFFRVRDYGVGLDAEGIREVYSQYGTSTKRNSDDVVGMLGLGCKSALTYADQFTVTGYKNGRCIQVSVSRDEDGTGSMTIVTDHEHDGENGVEVIVPAKRHNAFESKAHTFFQFWRGGSVLINGEAPKIVDGLWLNDSICLSQELEQSYIVMGNVAYPITDEFDPSPVTGGRYSYNRLTHHTAAFVPIGGVQFTPSREALQMTKLTKETLEKVKADVKELTTKAVQDQVANAPNAQEALRIFKEGKALGVTDGVRYKGREVMDSFKREGDPRADNKVGFLVAGSDSYRRKSGERQLNVSLEASYNRPTLWFENFDHVELSSPMRERLRAYAAQNSLRLDESRLVLIDSFTEDEKFWLDGVIVHDWANVAAIKLAQKDRTLDSGRPRGSYKGYKDGAWSDKIVADTIDTSKPILYVRGNRYSIQIEPEWRTLGIIGPNTGTVLAMEANRIDKFKRDFPMAKTFREFGKEYAESFAKSLTDDVREAAKYQRKFAVRMLKALDPAEVNDPEMKKAIGWAAKNVQATLETCSKLVRALGFDPLSDDKNIKDPAEKYPLLPLNITAKERPHVYLYLNAVYAAEGSAQ